MRRPARRHGLPWLRGSRRNSAGDWQRTDAPHLETRTDGAHADFNLGNPSGRIDVARRRIRGGRREGRRACRMATGHRRMVWARADGMGCGRTDGCRVRCEGPPAVDPDDGRTLVDKQQNCPHCDAPMLYGMPMCFGCIELRDKQRADRTPRPPAELVDALQDRVHPASGRFRTARSVKVRQCDAPACGEPATPGERQCMVHGGRLAEIVAANSWAECANECGPAIHLDCYPSGAKIPCCGGDCCDAKATTIAIRARPADHDD